MASKELILFRQQEQDDEEDTATIGWQESEDGFSLNDDSEMGVLKLNSRERKKRSQRWALYILVAFVTVMFIALIPLQSRRKNAQSENKSYEQGDVSKDLFQKRVYCSGKLTYKLDEWLDQDLSNTAELCDPDFKPQTEEIAMDKPVKVFIMLGEANMVGTGQISGNVPGTLEYTVKTKKRFIHLVDGDDKEWKNRTDVRFVAVRGEREIMKNNWLAVDDQHPYFGPELQFGFVMGEIFDGPVLLIKACSGHNSLGGDLLPPGSLQFEFGGWVYPGYGQGPRRWRVGTEPEPTAWHAGHAYDTTRDNIKAVLSNITDYYPGATNYDIAGIVFWQGDSDRRDSGYAGRYQRNLRSFIAGIRHDLGVPDAKVAIATLGQLGMDMPSDAVAIFEAQMAMGELFRDFRDTVTSVDIRSSWRTAYLPGYEGDDSMMDASHYGNNAETVMEVGNALGLAMAKLLLREPQYA